MQPDAAARMESQSRQDEDAERLAQPGADAVARRFHRLTESVAAGSVAELKAEAQPAELLLALQAQVIQEQRRAQLRPPA